MVPISKYLKNEGQDDLFQIQSVNQIFGLYYQIFDHMMDWAWNKLS